MLRKILLISFVILVVLNLNVQGANAYNYYDNKAKLTGVTPVYNANYWVQYEKYGDVPYRSYINSAVSTWNTKVEKTPLDSTDVYFVRKDQRYNTRVDFVMNLYGNTGWNAVATFYINSEGQISSTGAEPKKNYNYSEVRLNHTYLADDSAALIKATVMHEFGHALGLGHSGYLSSIMYKDRNRTTQTVADDDVKGVKNLY